ncbi:MAG TPA: hypothetical protein VNQ33_07715 [Acidimicrobiales bacterium]|nr:hypothetical protein [Acidimicrobiales bacterium]
MIVEAILDFIFAGIRWVISLVPAWTLPSFLLSPLSALTTLAANVAWMGNWLPWNVIVGGMALMGSVRLVMAAVEFVMKVYAMIRGGAS